MRLTAAVHPRPRCVSSGGRRVQPRVRRHTVQSGHRRALTQVTHPLRLRRRKRYRVMARITASLTPAAFSLIKVSGVSSNFEGDFCMVAMIMSSGSFATTIWMT